MLHNLNTTAVDIPEVPSVKGPEGESEREDNVSGSRRTNVLMNNKPFHA